VRGEWISPSGHEGPNGAKDMAGNVGEWVLDCIDHYLQAAWVQ